MKLINKKVVQKKKIGENEYMDTINNIPETVEEIANKLEELAACKILSNGKNYTDIEHNGEKNSNIHSEQVLETHWNERIRRLNKEKVGIDVEKQVLRSYHSLIENFESAKIKLAEIGIRGEDIAKACIERLINILEEVSESEKKLTNGNVLSLRSIQGKQLKTKTIGYYEFACCNVSLDKVKIQGKTLREISNLCNDTNDTGDLLLPNSLGVSISLIAEDDNGKPVFIGQFRNNETTMTQRESSKVVSAASGGIDPGINFTQMGSIELEEELGIKSQTKLISSEIHKLMTGREKEKEKIQIGEVLTDELGIKNAEIEFGGIVFEEKRKNPEIVLKASTNLKLEEIKKLWEKSKDRDESTGIRAISLEEIGDNLSGEAQTLSTHFIQSLLAWYITKKS